MKFCKLWKLLEQKYGIELDYEQFNNTLKASSLGVTVSNIDFLRLELIHKQHPDADTLIELIRLKNAYLADSGILSSLPMNVTLSTENGLIRTIMRCIRHFPVCMRPLAAQSRFSLCLTTA